MNPLETVIESTWPWPFWTAVFGLLVLVAAAMFLYRREPAEVGRGWRIALYATRLGTCALLVWMLGGWQRQQHRTESAELIVALDDSASMSFADEFSDSRVAARLKSLSQNRATPNPSPGSPISRFQLARSLLDMPQFGWLQWFEQNYRIKLRLVGDTTRDVEAGSLGDTQPTRPASKLGQAIRDLLAAQQGTPTAAMIVFTDGVTTAGPTLSEAAETAHRQGIPLYLIGMGGGQPPRDVRLADLLADDIAFAGDAVQVEAQLLAAGLQGQKTTVRLKRADNGEVLAEQVVAIDKPSVRLPIRLTFRPKAVGELALVLDAAAVPGESDVANNRLTHSLHVNDVAIKVLLIQAYPSYEYRFLKNLLSRATRASDSSGKAFELTTILQDADREHADQDESATAVFPANREQLDAFDVVLFGDVDPTLLGRAAMDNLVAFVREHGGSILFLAGPRFTPIAYRDTSLVQLFPFQIATVVAPAEPITNSFSPRLTAIGALNPACQLENSPEDNLAAWKSLPELYWSLDIPSPNAGARVLLEHPTQTTPDRQPLPVILTQFVNAGRVVFHATDETYRWARFRGSDEHYARYWLQTLRLLSRAKLQAGRSTAEIMTDRQQYVPADEVQLRVRFRQEKSDLDAVTVTLEQPTGARQSVTLRRAAENSSLFTAKVHDLVSGGYRVTLTSPLLDPPPLPRSFVVAGQPQEQIGVPLNAVEMQQAAKVSGGHYYEWFNADRLLRELPRGQRVRVESLPPEPIWNSSWVAATFVATLTVEWLLRKRIGML